MKLTCFYYINNIEHFTEHLTDCISKFKHLVLKKHLYIYIHRILRNIVKHEAKIHRHRSKMPHFNCLEFQKNDQKFLKPYMIPQSRYPSIRFNR